MEAKGVVQIEWKCFGVNGVKVEHTHNVSRDMRETEGLEDGLESEGMKVRKTNPNNMQHEISFWMNEWLVCFSFDAHQPIRFL